MFNRRSRHEAPMNSEPAETASKIRRHEQRASVRRQILAATEALLVSEGYEGFSIRRLVDRCGYTAPTIYHHFGDKAGLIDSLLEQRFREMAQRIDHVAECEDPAVQLRAQLLAFVEFGLENPTHYSLLMGPRPADVPPPETTEQSRKHIESTLSRLAREQRLRIDDIDEAIQCIWVMLHGLISTRVSYADYPWTESHIEQSLDILLRGLLKQGDLGDATRSCGNGGAS
jgi:AcrR family transcriptional regulator